MKPRGPTPLASSLRAFFSEHIPMTRGLSPHTVRSYRYAFVLLLRFLAVRHACDVVDLDVVHIGPEDLIAFLAHLEEKRGNCSTTRNARLAAVRSYARFLAARCPEFVERCQRILCVPTKRGRGKTVEYLESDEIRAILEAVDHHKPEGRRDHALLLTLFNTGARVQEMLDLRPTDLELERPYLVHLHGKGRKERACPLWPQTAESLRRLLAALSIESPKTTRVFLNRRGEPLTRFGVRYIVRRYAKRAEAAVPRIGRKSVHPHTFRHSTAVHLLRSGVDLVTISHWLGHECVETANRYAVIDLDAKRKALERAGPITENADTTFANWKTDISILDWLERL